MRLGPIGQKWVCAAGVERSTLHRCGLTGLGLINPFFHSSIGPGRSLFRAGIERKVEVIKMFLFAPQIKKKGSLSSWPIYILIMIYRIINKDKDSLSFNRLFFFVNAIKDL